MIHDIELPFQCKLKAFEELDMRRIILGLALVILLGCPALAQYFVVPGGGMLPDGSVRFTIPVGVPYTQQHNEWFGAYGVYSHYLSSPVYWIPYPYVAVPMGRPQPPTKGPSE